MKIFIFIFSISCLIFSFSSFSLDRGTWSFVKTDEYCYIGSMPTETDLAKDKKRGYSQLIENILHPKTEVIGGIMASECSKLLRDFFEGKR